MENKNIKLVAFIMSNGNILVYHSINVNWLHKILTDLKKKLASPLIDEQGWLIEGHPYFALLKDTSKEKDNYTRQYYYFSDVQTIIIKNNWQELLKTIPKAKLVRYNTVEESYSKALFSYTGY